MAAHAQRRAGAEEGAPDHQVARELLDPRERVAEHVAREHVGDHQRRHHGQHRDQRPAVGGYEAALEGRWPDVLLRCAHRRLLMPGACPASWWRIVSDISDLASEITLYFGR